MSKLQGFILYKIYYDDNLVYVGRTKQPLQTRIRGHLFKMPMHRSLDINLISKIEFSKFKTEADMNLYEIYYINLLKPPLNIDDKCIDELSVRLEEVQWKEYTCHLWDKWKHEINIKNTEYKNKRTRLRTIREEISLTRKKYKMGEISKEQYEEEIEKLTQENIELGKYFERRY